MADVIKASMRPGRARPGDQAAGGVLVASHNASMRPGRARPGDHDLREGFQP